MMSSFRDRPKSQNSNFNDREPYLYDVITQKILSAQFLLKTPPHQTQMILKIKSSKILKHHNVPLVWPTQFFIFEAGPTSRNFALQGSKI